MTKAGNKNKSPLHDPLASNLDAAGVGLFWFVDEELVSAGVPLSDAYRYGDCLTYEGGHAEHWESWRNAGPVWMKRHGLPLLIIETEYDSHPRGRVVFNETAGKFIIYADRRLHSEPKIRRLCDRFHLPREKVAVLADSHYR